MTAKTNDLLAEFASPSLTPSLLQSLLHRLLSHPAIHNGFLSVLELPTVQSALANNPQRDVIVRTLELFGHGTVDDYYELNDKVMKLNDAQLEKLRMLTVVSIVKCRIDDGDVEMDPPKAKKISNKKKLSIPYAELANKLHLPPNNIRQLEDLLIQCIYANILCGKLDQYTKCLIIEPHQSIHRDDENVCGSFLSRDSTSNSVSGMIFQLESFLKHSECLLSALEGGTKTNTAVRRDDALRWKEVNRLLSGDNNSKLSALEREEGGERREVKRSKMVMGRFG